MSLSSRKGYEAEAALVNYLRVNGWPEARRPPMGEHKDVGDVEGTPGLAWEVRNRALIRVGGWADEAAEIAGRIGADFGFLIVKPRLVGPNRVANWLAAFSLSSFSRLMSRGETPSRLWTVAEFNHDMLLMSRALGALQFGYAMYNRHDKHTEAEPESMDGIYAVLRVADLVTLLHQAGYGVEVPA